MEEQVQPRSKRRRQDRLQDALLELIENPKVDIASKLQAIKISADIESRRVKPRRKSDKDKMIEAALVSATPKKKT